MPSTDEREAQPVLGETCPKCGSDLVLRNAMGRFFAKCRRSSCSFTYDSDLRGNPTARCSTCGTGRLHTTGTARVCADCGATEGARPAPAKAEGLGPCPKCQKGTLAVRSGAFGTFVSCSERCGLTYSSDAEGVPEGGYCSACKGPVKKTQKGSRLCVVCGKWQDERPARPAAAQDDNRPPKPKPAHCPRCNESLKTVFTRRQKWAYRCDPCDAWYDA
nr:topoisomerase DNA-binding C4 zinc finger domain-containing protein [uncultured Holophaga sp.]